MKGARSYILFVIFGLASLIADCQKIEVISIHEAQHFYVNSMSRPGGKSRVYLPVELPENTVAWCYTYSCYRDENEINRTKSTLKLALELTRLLDNNTGIISAALQQVTAPPGGDACDVYLLDSLSLEQYLKVDMFGLYEFFRPDYIKDGTRENFASGAIKITNKGYLKGKYYIGINNPSLIYGIHAVLSVVAITKTDTTVVVPSNKDLVKLGVPEKWEIGDHIIDRFMLKHGGYDYINEIDYLSAQYKYYANNKCFDVFLEGNKKLEKFTSTEHKSTKIYSLSDSIFDYTSPFTLFKNNYINIINMFATKDFAHLRFEYAGTEKMMGRLCYKLRWNISKKENIYYYFDINTLNIINLKYINKITDKNVLKNELHFSSFRNITGLPLPYLTEYVSKKETIRLVTNGYTNGYVVKN